MFSDQNIAAAPAEKAISEKPLLKSAQKRTGERSVRTSQKTGGSSLQNPLVKLAIHGPIIFKSDMPRHVFHDFVLQNEETKIERDKNGTITIHPPMTLKSGYNEGKAFLMLGHWAMFNEAKGKAFSPSTSFDLPDGSTPKADGAWISNEKLSPLSEEEFDSITQIVPDFVIETRSKSDSLAALKRKMMDVWIANGVQLAWLIDPKSQKAWIYRADGSVAEVTNFDGELSGENVLEGFVLDLKLLR